MAPNTDLLAEVYEDLRPNSVLSSNNDSPRLAVKCPLYRQSLEVARYVVARKLNVPQTKRHDIGEKTYKLCRDIEAKHELVFKSVGPRLNLNGENFRTAMNGVVEEMFQNSCNFGRIISLYALCMSVAEYCNLNGLNNEVDVIADLTADTVLKHRKWFEQNGGWEGLVKFFSNPADNFWKGLFVTTVGLGALAGLLYAKS